MGGRTSGAIAAAVIAIVTFFDIVAAPAQVPSFQPSPTGNWTGPYVGIVFGGESPFSNIRVDTDQRDVTARSPYVGFQAGYNYQPVGSNYLIGAQFSTGFLNINDRNQVGTVDVTTKSSVEGSALVRGGVFVAPQTLVFVSTGLAFLEQKVTVSNPTTQLWSTSTTRLGFEVVVGVEKALSDDWHARLCGVFADFGTHTYWGTVPVQTQVGAVRLSFSRRVGQ